MSPGIEEVGRMNFVTVDEVGEEEEEEEQPQQQPAVEEEEQEEEVVVSTRRGTRAKKRARQTPGEVLPE